MEKKKDLQTTVKMQSFELEREERDYSMAIPLRSGGKKRGGRMWNETSKRHKGGKNKSCGENDVKYLVRGPNRWSRVQRGAVV